MPWLGEVPAHWNATRLKFAARVQTGIALGKTYNEAMSEFPYLRVANVQDGFIDLSDVKTIMVPEREAASALLRDGDVLMNEGGDADKLGRGAIWEGTISPCLHQNHVFALRPHSVSSKWLSTWIGSAYAKAYFETRAKQSTNLASISSTNLLELPIALPPQDEQQAIIEYTSRATARIDALVAAKQRVIDLLYEKRKAIVATAVTRGLDSKVKLRDSGVPWLGEIPTHWEVERARRLFRERDVRSTSGEEEMLTVSHLTGVTPRSEKDVNMFEAETNEGYKLCESGDLVINTLWAWMGAMGIAPVKGIVSPAYNVYEPGPRLAPAYIDALVRLPVFAQEVTRYSKGVWSSRLRLYPEGFFEVVLPVPPQEEQRAVVKHIARETAKLDAVRTATERTIALLNERRSAVIAAAVTGLLDVRAAA